MRDRIKILKIAITPENLQEVDIRDVAKEYILEQIAKLLCEKMLKTKVSFIEFIGRGAFSEAFKVVINGKSLALKLSTSSDEVEPYAEIEKKRKTLPEDLKSVLPDVSFAKVIPNDITQELLPQYADILELPIEDVFYRFNNGSLQHHFKSMIIMELLSDLDEKTRALIIGDLKSAIDSALGKTYNENENTEETNIQSIKDLFSKASQKISYSILDKYKKEELKYIQKINICTKEIPSIMGLALDKILKKFIDMVSAKNQTEQISSMCKIVVTKILNEIISIFKVYYNIILPDAIIIKNDLTKVFSDIHRDFMETIPFRLKQIIENQELDFPWDYFHNKHDHPLNDLLGENSFINKLLKLKEYGIIYSDVHQSNIMIRKSTGELVVSDLGLFNFE